MNLIKIKCALCGKEIFRSKGRVNEAKKFGWKQYCSKECQNQAKIKRIKLKCANPDCNNVVYREPSELRKSKTGRVFCSQSCAASFNNSKFPKIKRGRKIKICEYCGKEFRGKGTKYCSRECQYKAQTVTKKKILEKIKKFYEKNGRIPLKKEVTFYNAARNRFGTWNKAIKAAGFESNPVLFAKKWVANDGHKCDSLAEKIIDDWLSARKIQHKRAVPYPENSSLTVDFLTENNWIEFFGLAGVIKKYDQLIKKKLILAKKYKLPLIKIYPKDLFPINHLSEIIKVKET